MRVRQLSSRRLSLTWQPHLRVYLRQVRAGMRRLRLIPLSRDANLSWKATINSGWTKRQEMIEEVKRQNAKKTEFDRIAEMDYDDLHHNYSEIILAKKSGDLRQSIL